MDGENSFLGRTYFEGDAQLPVPPEYFLQRIYDYDALLVMFPSQVRVGAYVVARRRENSPGLTSAALAAVANPDTKTCMAMGWVPVCIMFQVGLNWNPEPLIAKLTARDIRANGGADKVADLLEQQEADAEVARKKALRDDLWDRSGEGWRTYQARTGASSIQFHGEVKAPVSETTVSTVSTPRSTAGLGTGDNMSSGMTIGGEV
jgi:hypothetical protein